MSFGSIASNLHRGSAKISDLGSEMLLKEYIQSLRSHVRYRVNIVTSSHITPAKKIDQTAMLSRCDISVIHVNVWAELLLVHKISAKGGRSRFRIAPEGAVSHLQDLTLL